MARLTDRQKLQRAVELLAGMGHPEARKALQARGLSTQELEEGYRLLRAAIETFHAADEHAEPPDTVALLDAWENRWLPIVGAALEHRFPSVAKSVLLNLRQLSGPALLISLPTLLDRIEALEHSKLTPARQAHALLTQRGLTPQVLAEARTLSFVKSVAGKARPPKSWTRSLPTFASARIDRSPACRDPALPVGQS